MEKKAQAGLEYLMTYGWALIMIATIIGVLVFILPVPEQIVFQSSDMTRLPIKGATILNGMAIIKQQNITGGTIKITKLDTQGYGTCTINEKDLEVEERITIGPGGEIIIECILIGNEPGRIRMEYTDQTGIEREVEVTEEFPRDQLECLPKCEQAEDCIEIPIALVTECQNPASCDSYCSYSVLHEGPVLPESRSCSEYCEFIGNIMEISLECYAAGPEFKWQTPQGCIVSDIDCDTRLFYQGISCSGHWAIWSFCSCKET